VDLRRVNLIERSEIDAKRSGLRRAHFTGVPSWVVPRCLTSVSGYGAGAMAVVNLAGRFAKLSTTFRVPNHAPNSAILTSDNCTDLQSTARIYGKCPANG
jgi:hypothetical protein